MKIKLYTALTMLSIVLLCQSCCDNREENMPSCRQPNWENVSFYFPKNIKINDYWVFKESQHNTIDTIRITNYTTHTVKHCEISKQVSLFCKRKNTCYACNDEITVWTNPIRNNRYIKLQTSLQLVSIKLMSNNNLIYMKSSFMKDSITVQGKTYYNITVCAYEENQNYTRDTVWFAKDIGPIKWKTTGVLSYNFEKL